MSVVVCLFIEIIGDFVVRKASNIFNISAEQPNETWCSHPHRRGCYCSLLSPVSLLIKWSAGWRQSVLIAVIGCSEKIRLSCCRNLLGVIDLWWVNDQGQCGNMDALLQMWCCYQHYITASLQPVNPSPFLLPLPSPPLPPRSIIISCTLLAWEKKEEAARPADRSHTSRF